MRYPEGHREKTRARILEAAARLFKVGGYAATGVDAVMSAAELTTGGFYNHFASKDALFAGTLDAALGAQNRSWLEADPGAGSAAWVKRFVDRYLSEPHRDGVEQGCPLPSLAPEAARASGEVRRNLERRVRELVPHLEAKLEGADPSGRAIALLALGVGGIVLARAVADRAFSAEILAACRRAAHRLAARPG